MEQPFIDETKSKIEHLIRQERPDEARALLVFLRDRGVEPDADIKQFQNIVGMPVREEQSLAERHDEEEREKRRQFLLDRATGLAIVAFLFITTGSFLLAGAYLFLDWTINLGQQMSLKRYMLTATGALILFVVAAFVLVVVTEFA